MSSESDTLDKRLADIYKGKESEPNLLNFPKVEIVYQSGTKYDSGKPRLELLPPSYWKSVNSQHSYAMSMWHYYEATFPCEIGFDAVPILEFGAEKYDSYNWFKGMSWGRLVGAFHRHCNYLEEACGMWAPRDLSAFDEESTLAHGSHAECCRIFLQEYYATYKEGKIIGEADCPWCDNVKF